MKQASSLFLSLCFLTACSSPEPPATPTPTPIPTPTKLESALEDEMLVIGTPDERLKVRDAVKEYLKSSRPEAEVKGISLNHLENTSIYQVAADVSEKGKPKIIQLKAWLIVNDNGDSYWKAGGP